jgi:serine/threonine protein kinase
LSKDESKLDFEESSKRFGRYKVLEHLAKGGMAQIYKAETPNGKVFTLKKILSDFSSNPEFIKMFLEEAKISLQLKNSHIVRVLDFGQVEGVYFLAMEYVFGRDLGTLLRTCVEKKVYVPIDVACFMMLQCAKALDYAHTWVDELGKPSEIVHRDISPPNILVSYNGEPKILDFGIAKAQRSPNRRNTRSGVLKGKFSYMSPEQATGQTLTGSSDQFSLGIVFHELLTCRSLFYSKDEMETLERVRKADVPAPRKFRPEIPVELEKIVMKSLSRKTRSRFKSCREFAEAIRDFLRKNYPRTDARTVARFARSLFPQDFQARSQSALREGWVDVLVSGGADDDLLLDRTFSEEMAQRHLGADRNESLSAWQRALYDPHVNAQVKSWIWKSALIIGVMGLGALGWSSGYIERLPQAASTTFNRLLNFDWAAYLSTAGSKPTPSVTSTHTKTPNETVPFGGFAYWKQMADEAEANGRWEEAETALKRAIEINPFETSLQTRREFVTLYQGQLDSSCRYFQTTSDVSPADKLLASSICAEGRGDWIKAASGYQDFLRLYAQDPRSAKVSWALKQLRGKIQQ